MMSDHGPDPESSAESIEDGNTEDHPTVTEAISTPHDGPGWLVGDDGGDSAEEWVSQTTHGIRLTVPAAVLVALVLVAGGFWAGAALQKGQGSSSSGGVAGVAARFRAAAGAGATGGSGASRFAGLFGSTAAAVGTVSVVNGNTLYVDDTATGSIVKVRLTKSTTITRNADATAIDLRPGDTVTVQGATGSGGTVDATSVSATAPGVTSGFGGFGGFGGAGTGAATSTATTGSNTTTTPALFGGSG